MLKIWKSCCQSVIGHHHYKSCCRSQQFVSFKNQPSQYIRWLRTLFQLWPNLRPHSPVITHMKTTSLKFKFCKLNITKKTCGVIIHSEGETIVVISRVTEYTTSGKPTVQRVHQCSTQLSAATDYLPNQNETNIEHAVRVAMQYMITVLDRKRAKRLKIQHSLKYNKT